MRVLLNIPNILTILRIIVIPAFITCMLYERYDYALYLFAFAALTDKLDGFIARRLNEKTEFGTFLDPLADKFMLVSAFILLAIKKLIPLWLVIMAISRDIIVVTGWFIIFLITKDSKVETLPTGKLAIASQFLLICFFLLHINYDILDFMEMPFIFITAILTVLSGLHYIHRGLKITSAE